MKRTVQLCLAAAIAVWSAGSVYAQGRPFDAPPARTSQGPAGGVLSLPSNASPRATLAQYLRGTGHDEVTVQSLVEGVRNPGGRGVSHQRFEQRAGGLPVYGTYAKAAFNARGELVHVVENLAAVPRSVARARVNAQQAIAAALAAVYPTFRTIPAGFFRREPSAARVAIPHADGTMSAGYLVETWTERTNQLHETLVDGDGTVLGVELRTNSDSYNVFRINPLVTPQAVVAGAAAGPDAPSPNGWLFAGTQNSTRIAGNNVAAYLDVISDNRYDTLGTSVTSGEFLTAADATTAPSTAQNRRVAVQNLFYLNNLIHDELYRHGFTEAALNFQENNFGKGGSGSDSVNAEAQDGGGTDNANFATPRDGSNPRMQMYLWNGVGTHTVLADRSYLAQGAEFGPALTVAGVTGGLKFLNDAGGVSRTDGCEAFPAGSLNGSIAIMDRGNCDFVTKVKNAQNAGAMAAIVVNNVAGDAIQTMGGSDRTVTIGSVFVGNTSGGLLKAQAGRSASVARSNPQPLQRDGDVDADIVFHEYCHGLTWRMIGSMSGVTAGAIGEGMSDVCAMLLTTFDPAGGMFAGADRIGEYSASDPVGIRRGAYDTYTRTYADVAGASVHDDGEIYAAIGWKLIKAFGPSRLSELFDYLVDGMNYTPSAPTYEQMRDGILQSVGFTPTHPTDDACLVWQSFAAHGVGVGAKATVRKSGFTITASSAVPAACVAR